MASIELSRRLATGVLFESWLAKETETGRRLFVKKPARADRDQAEERAKRCLTAVRELNHPHILAPAGVFDHNGRKLTAFPYFASEDRLDLNADLFAQSHKWLLPLICQVVDFIHCHGWVHCDIKESNFLLVKDSLRPRLFLTDFDLVTEAGSRPSKKIFGTLGYIAPEITRDYIVLPQSDHYSLGVMLWHLMGCLGEEPPDEIGEADLRPEFASYLTLLKSLLRKEASDRPSYLGQVLTAAGSPVTISTREYDFKLLRSVAKSKAGTTTGLTSESQLHLSTFVQENLKLVGIPEELVTDAECALEDKPLAVIRSLAKLVGRSRIARYGDLWHVRSDAADIAEFYRSSWLPKSLVDVLGADGSSSWEEMLGAALRFKVKKAYWKALLIIESMLAIPEERLNSEQLQNRPGLLLRAGNLSRLCGLREPSMRYTLEALAADVMSPRKRTAVLIELVDLNQKDPDSALYHKLLNEAGELAHEHNLRRARIQIARKKLTLDSDDRDLRASIPKLERLARAAADDGFTDAYSSVCNQIGIVYRNVGELDRAMSTFRQGIDCLEDNQSLKKPVALYNNLAAAQFDLGEYELSMGSSNKALELLDNRRNDVKSTFAYRNLASCHTLTGAYDLADLNLLKYRDARLRARNVLGVGSYYLESGWMSLKRGNLDKAYLHLQTALRMFKSLEQPAYIGRALCYLGTLFYWRGKLDEAAKLATEARRIFAQVDDPLSEADAHLLVLRIAAADGGTLDPGPVIAVLDTYVGVHNYLGAVNSLMFLAVSGFHTQALAYLDGHSDLRKYVDSTAIPLAQGLSHLLAFWRLSAADQAGDAVGELKESFTILRSAFLYHDASAVARLLAKHYEDVDNMRLAIGYLTTGRRLANLLDNEALEEQLRDAIPGLKRRDTGKGLLLKMLGSIGELLSSMEDYRVVTARILEYAVTITGAERGVILLFDEREGILRVNASYDCDRQSISDIKEISNSVIDSVVESQDPYLIDDATKHRATRDRKSIIKHNILSIACLPLFVRDRLIGALYLDHHIITGMFTPEDHIVIKAVSDFVAIAVELAGKARTQRIVLEETRRQLQKYDSKQKLVTEDRAMLGLLDLLQMVANSSLSILLVGETGTGKEILSRMIHEQSDRSSGPLEVVNCNQLGRDLLESALFGTKPGAYTGARDREGALERADGGTLFLDEVDDLPIAIQGALLRAIEEQTFMRLGGSNLVSVDFRLVTATKRDLKKLVETGEYRADFYHRIANAVINIPPLRDRIGDVPILVDHFLSMHSPDGSVLVSKEAMAYLQNYSWPGNIRELENLIRNLCVTVRTGVVEVSDLPADIQRHARGAAGRLKQSIARMECEQIQNVLKKHKGNQSKAAQELGMPLTTFRRKMKKYGTDPLDYK